MPPKAKESSGARTAARSHAAGAGAKRGRGGEETGSSEGVKRGRGNEVNAAGFRGAELPDASLGDGPVWELEQACLRSAEKTGGSSQGHQSRMARGQLDQALSCDRKTDVRFELDDGATVGGHQSILSIASEGLGAMFESGMIEGREGVVRLRGFKGSAVKGLLEWVYLGHAGENCEKADGRELWVLAEMYDVPGVREWLVEESIDFGNFCAACEFGLLPEGDRRELVAACQDFAEGIEPDYLKEKIRQKGLVGVGSKAMRVLLEAVMKQVTESEEEKKKEEVEKCVLEEGLLVRISSGFRFLQQWWTANEGKQGRQRGEDVDELVALLDLGKLPWADLRKDVRFSGLVSSHQMNELYEKKLGEADNKIEKMNDELSNKEKVLATTTTSLASKNGTISSLNATVTHLQNCQAYHRKMREAVFSGLRPVFTMFAGGRRTTQDSQAMEQATRKCFEEAKRLHALAWPGKKFNPSMVPDQGLLRGIINKSQVDSQLAMSKLIAKLTAK